MHGPPEFHLSTTWLSEHQGWPWRSQALQGVALIKREKPLKARAVPQSKRASSGALGPPPSRRAPDTSTHCDRTAGDPGTCSSHYLKFFTNLNKLPACPGCKNGAKPQLSRLLASKCLTSSSCTGRDFRGQQDSSRLRVQDATTPNLGLIPSKTALSRALTVLLTVNPGPQERIPGLPNCTAPVGTQGNP